MRALWVVLGVCVGLLLFGGVVDAAVRGGGNVTNTSVSRIDFVDAVGVVGEVEHISAPQLEVFSTLYYPGEVGKIFLQLDQEGDPINNATCFVRVWYPNGTVLIGDTFMPFLEEGIYFYDLLIPNATGVYPVSAKCALTGVTVEEAFISHVTYDSGMSGLNSFAATYVLDGLSYQFIEGGASNLLNTTVYLNASGLSYQNWSTMTFDQLFRRKQQVGDPAGDFFLGKFFNYTSGSYVITGFGFYFDEWLRITMGFSTGAITDFINQTSGEIKFQWYDALGVGDGVAGTNIDTDFLRIVGTVNATNQTIEFLRGGGELNVKAREPVTVDTLAVTSIDVPLQVVGLFLWLVFLGIVLLYDQRGADGLFGLVSIIFGISLLPLFSFWFGGLILGAGLFFTGRMLFKKQ